MAPTGYRDCPFCGEENPAGAIACGCGYRFSGYAEAEMKAMDEAAEEAAGERRRAHVVGAGLIFSGLVLSAGNCVMSEAAGLGRFAVFSGLILAGVVVLFRGRLR